MSFSSSKAHYQFDFTKDTFFTKDALLESFYVQFEPQGFNEDIKIELFRPQKDVCHIRVLNESDLTLTLCQKTELEFSIQCPKTDKSLGWLEKFLKEILCSKEEVIDLTQTSFFALRQFIASHEIFKTYYLGTKNKIKIEESISGVSLFESDQSHPAISYEAKPKQYAKFLSLLDYVFLEFSCQNTQYIMTLNSALKSPLAILLPFEIFDAKVEENCYWESQCLKEDSYCSSFENSLVSNLILYLQKQVKKNQIDIYLVEKPYQDEGFRSHFLGEFQLSGKIKAIEVKSILFEEGKLSIKNDKLVFTVSYPINLKEARIMGSAIHLPEEGKLFVTQEDEYRKKIKNLFSSDRLKFELKSLGFTVEKDSLKRSVSYEESLFANPAGKIRNFESVLPVPIENNVHFTNIEIDKLRAYFVSQNPGRVEIAVLDQELDTEFLSVQKLARFLFGIKTGLAQFMGRDAVNIAINGSKRSNELKILKSSGFFVFLLQKLFIEDGVVEKELTQIINFILETKNKDMEDLISPFLIDFIKDSIKDFEKGNEFSVIQNDRIQRVDFSKTLKLNLGVFIKNLKQFYGKHVYLLDDVVDFDGTLNQNKLKGLTLTVEQKEPFLIDDFLQINECSFDENSLSTLPENLFKTSVSIVEEKSIDQARPEGQNEWFELDPKYYFDGKEISEEEAKKFQTNKVIQYKGKHYYISPQNQPNIRLLNFLWNKQDFSKKNKKNKQEVKFYRSYILDILALKMSGLPIEGSERWDKILEEYENLDKPIEIIKEGFHGELKDFQKKGVSWISQLYKIGLGGVLADDMGLGKTVQVLAFLNHLKFLNPTEKKLHLIVVPTSLVHNWKSEIEKFTPHFDTLIFKSGAEKELFDKKEGLVIVTYGLLSEWKNIFKDIDFDAIILDEAQQIKNITSKRSQAAKDLRAYVKICLTGTPMENHYGEFYSLIDTSAPGALGAYDKFIKVYGPKKVSTGQVQDEEILYLKKKVKPLVLRRTKKEVLKDLPEKTESVIRIDFDDEQKEIYKSIAALWNTKIQSLLKEQGETKSQIQMFAALMKLRQVCSCPDIVVGPKYSRISPKLKLVVEQVTELIEAEKSVIVFTNFITTLEKIKRELISRDMPVLSITGKDSRKKREKTLEEFNAEGDKVLIMTLKTGGVGLNLTKANYIIHVEPWWNPAAENQGTDRAHRIGQKQSVHVYRYIMTNSIEEKIQSLKDLKQEAFSTLLSETEGDLERSSFSTGQGLTQKDFEYLLGQA